MIVHTTAYPRGGLVGNPSDGYFGKTIAFTFTNFQADVTLYETPELEILPNTRDHSVFAGIKELNRDVRLFGYYGGIRLLKATVKRFYDHCSRDGIDLHERNFTLRYRSSIPHQVGLAGSSAIIAACVRALKAFYGVSIPMPEEANLILSVEKEELQIGAGLQDRVAQVYQGLVYMDFDRELMRKHGHGRYEYLDPLSLPNIYIAYRADLSEGSEIFHNNIRERFDRGEPEILDAIRFWTELTDRVRQCLDRGEKQKIGPLLNDNFDRRAAIYKISEGNQRMIKAARSVGASAKFTGSGGAIVGTYEDERMFAALQGALEPLRIRIIKPNLAPALGDHAP